MPARVDLYSAYSHFTDTVMDAVRTETFGVDIGQNSWITVNEYDRFLSWLHLPPHTPHAAHAGPHSHILEVACGSGGPALHLARTLGCRVTGIDAEASAIATATRMAEAMGMSKHSSFSVADANARLPFDDGSFDGIVCIDAMNHLPDRLAVLREWHRVLRPGRKALFTDPVVITGPVTNEELAARSSIGLFLFVPPAVNERLIEQAGLRLIRQEDVTDNAALIAGRWHAARHAHKEELVALEGAERFDGLQGFFEMVHSLTSQRRLSRIAYLAEKPVG